MSVLDRPFHLPARVAVPGIGRGFSLTITFALVILAILLPVVQSGDETQQGYQIRALQQQKTDLEAQIYAAQADVAQLGTLSRINNDARNRLGMIPAGPAVIVNVSVPRPAFRPIPARFIPPSPTPVTPVRDGPLRRLKQLLPFS